MQAAVAELSGQKQQLVARRDAIQAAKARQETRKQIVDHVRAAAHKALEELETPAGLRRALNAFDVKAQFYKADNGHRHLRISGRVVVAQRASRRS